MRWLAELLVGLIIVAIIIFLSYVAHVNRSSKSYICTPKDSTAVYIEYGLEDNLYIIDTERGSVYFRTSCKETNVDR